MYASTSTTHYLCASVFFLPLCEITINKTQVFLSLSLFFSVYLLVYLITEVPLKGSFSIITALTPYSHPQLESVALTPCTLCALFS